MAVAAIVGVALSAIGVYLVWTTFSETKETNRIAKREAERSALEAEATRNHIIKTERAILRVTNCIIEAYPKASPTFEVTLKLRNDGRSNAWDINVSYAVQTGTKLPNKFKTTPTMSMILQAEGKGETANIRLRKPKSFPAYFFGYVAYATAHDAHFRTYFCYKFAGTPGVDGHGGSVFNPEDVQHIVSLPSDT